MIRLYTDGACTDTDEGVKVGWAWAVIYDNLPGDLQCRGCDSGKLYEEDYIDSRNVAGEVFAVMHGTRELISSGIRNVTIYYDYEGIEKWVTGEWNAKIDLTKLYKCVIERFIDAGLNIHFHHVKAHSGDRWNEYVDRLAKEAIGL